MIFPTGMSTAFAADDMSGVQEIQAQTHAVRGVINDANGPVAGVNVIVKGTTNGAISNGTGAYVLQNVPVGSVLQFTFIGYKTQEVTVGTQEVINVFMEEDTNLLEELVVGIDFVFG